MSQKEVESFYQELERNPELRISVLTLQKKFRSQEEVIRAFIDLGAAVGFHFDAGELAEYIFTHGRPEK